MLKYIIFREIYFWGLIKSNPAKAMVVEETQETITLRQFFSFEKIYLKKDIEIL
jgi:hypothetical protein